MKFTFSRVKFSRLEFPHVETNHDAWNHEHEISLFTVRLQLLFYIWMTISNIFTWLVWITIWHNIGIIKFAFSHMIDYIHNQTKSFVKQKKNAIFFLQVQKRKNPK